jgi:hypothetical protein
MYGHSVNSLLLITGSLLIWRSSVTVTQIQRQLRWYSSRQSISPCAHVRGIHSFTIFHLASKRGNQLRNGWQLQGAWRWITP